MLRVWPAVTYVPWKHRCQKPSFFFFACSREVRKLETPCTGALCRLTAADFRIFLSTVGQVVFSTAVGKIGAPGVLGGCIWLFALTKFFSGLSVPNQVLRALRSCPFSPTPSLDPEN
jgi:hypothetical protein